MRRFIGIKKPAGQNHTGLEGMILLMQPDPGRKSGRLDWKKYGIEKSIFLFL